MDIIHNLYYILLIKCTLIYFSALRFMYVNTKILSVQFTLQRLNHTHIYIVGGECEWIKTTVRTHAYSEYTAKSVDVMKCHFKHSHMHTSGAVHFVGVFVVPDGSL